MGSHLPRHVSPRDYSQQQALSPKIGRTIAWRLALLGRESSWLFGRTSAPPRKTKDNPIRPATTAKPRSSGTAACGVLKPRDFIDFGLISNFLQFRVGTTGHRRPRGVRADSRPVSPRLRRRQEVGLIVILELHRRASGRTDPGWVLSSAVRSAWQPSLATVLNGLSTHLAGKPAVADTLWWVVHRLRRRCPRADRVLEAARAHVPVPLGGRPGQVLQQRHRTVPARCHPPRAADADHLGPRPLGPRQQTSCADGSRAGVHRRDAPVSADTATDPSACSTSSVAPSGSPCSPAWPAPH